MLNHAEPALGIPDVSQIHSDLVLTPSSGSTSTAAPTERIKPGLAESYRTEMARLSEAPDASEHGEDLGIIRGLVDRVTVMPATDQSGLSIELEGDIIAMIGLALNAESGRKHMFSAADHALALGPRLWHCKSIWLRGSETTDS